MNRNLFIGSSLVGLLMLSAAPALADEPGTTVVQPAPAAPVVINNTDHSEGTGPAYPGVMWGGVAMWGVAYSAAVITAAAMDDVCDASSRMCVNGRGVLYVPVVGPFIALANVKGSSPATMKALLGIDGGFQLGGVAMALTGLFLSASSASQKHAEAPKNLVVAPYVSQTSAGFGAVGHF